MKLRVYVYIIKIKKKVQLEQLSLKHIIITHNFYITWQSSGFIRITRNEDKIEKNNYRPSSIQNPAGKIKWVET